MEENDFVLKEVGTSLHIYLGFELSMANSTALREMLNNYRGQDINRMRMATSRKRKAMTLYS